MAIQLLGPHRGRHGAARAGRAEVRARREPQARLRRAAGQPVDRLGTAAVIRGAFVDARRTTWPSRPSRGQGLFRTDRCASTRDLKLEALGLRARGGRSPGGSTATAPTTSRPRCGSPASSAMTWSSTTAPRRYLLADKIAAAGGAGGDRAADHRRSKVELRNRTLANPGRARGGRGHDRDRDRSPGGRRPPADPQAALAVKEGLDRDDGAARGHDQPGPDHAGRRPDRVAGPPARTPTWSSGPATRST